MVDCWFVSFYIHSVDITFQWQSINRSSGLKKKLDSGFVRSSTKRAHVENQQVWSEIWIRKSLNILFLICCCCWFLVCVRLPFNNRVCLMLGLFFWEAKKISYVNNLKFGKALDPKTNRTEKRRKKNLNKIEQFGIVCLRAFLQ